MAGLDKCALTKSPVLQGIMDYMSPCGQDLDVVLREMVSKETIIRGREGIYFFWFIL